VEKREHNLVRLRRSRRWRLRALLLSCATAATASLRADPFYMGADISMLPFLEGRGAVYKDGGQVRPAEQILVNHGANLFRIRLFVNPSSNYDDPSNRGAIQDLNYDISLAQRLKATGAKIALDIHYSDTWTNPGLQGIPAAWQGETFSQLNTTVHDYTLNTLDAFKAAGVMPDIVGIGNETTSGMLWPQGELDYNDGTPALNASWGQYGQLVNSAISGVRQAQSPGQHISVMLTAAPGDEFYTASTGGLPRWFYDNLINNGKVTDFDIMGIDSYPINSGSLTGLKNNLNDLATRYGKKVMLMETSQPWETSSSITGPYPSTKAGQSSYLADIRNTVESLPNGEGLGAMWWYPEAIPVPNTFIWENGATALFDAQGNALPALSQMSISPPTWNLDADGNWYNASNWAGGVPMFAGNAASFGSIITAPRTITLNGPQSCGIVTFTSPIGYTITGSTLTMDAVSGDAAISVTNGSHTISAPLTLNDNLDIAVSSATSVLTLSGAMSAAGRTITTSGSGAVRFANVRADTLAINGGTVGILANGTASGTSTLKTLTLAGGASPTATLDLADNAMAIDYGVGASPLSLIQKQIAFAYHNGLQDRAGIKTSLGAAYGVGFAEAATLSTVPSIFGTVDATTLLLRSTRFGDSNLDGVVNLLDLNSLATNFGSNTGIWTVGDFNYDGVTNVLDFNLLASNFGQSDAQSSPSLGQLVPEPCMMSAVAAAVLWMSGCRNRGGQRAEAA
jgi:arabinogalactan endo-1,4-beta-galactosidase